MNTVVPLPVKPRPPRHRPLVCHGVYGRPGGLDQPGDSTATARGVSSAILSPTRPRSVDHFEDFLDMVHRCGVFYAPPSIAANRAASDSTCPASSWTALINGAISSP